MALDLLLSAIEVRQVTAAPVTAFFAVGRTDLAVIESLDSGSHCKAIASGAKEPIISGA
jgi:hypothetical protein